jgi:hypothetical protein
MSGMTPSFRNSAAALALTLAASACATAPAASPASPAVAAAPGLAERLSDTAFWALQARISEPGGYFRIEDNFTSNETEVADVFTLLRQRGTAGDVFLGVGPEQNFTYIAAVRPRMAFVIDIRRQAVVQHLMFKALFEMAADRADFVSLLFSKPRPAADRADFVSLLFSKPRPAAIDTATSGPDLWSAFRMVRSDTAMAIATHDRIVDHLTHRHGFRLDPQELAQLRHVYMAFQRFGPAITTRGPPSGRGGDFLYLTGFAEDSAGEVHTFLSSEENFRVVKSLHERNLIVPVSGDFAGPKAIRAIGEYLRARKLVLRAFYVSNVEQYLFGDALDKGFYANVATLPLDSASVFIRPYTLRRWYRGIGGTVLDGRRQALCPIQSFLGAADKGLVTNNDEALACPR